MAELVKHPTVIELDSFSEDDACFFIRATIDSIGEHIRRDPDRRDGELHHALLIDEAHVIAGRCGEARASEEVADPKAFNAQAIARVLAEWRKLGEGVILADQRPLAVDPAVLQIPVNRLAFRQIDEANRKEICSAMGGRADRRSRNPAIGARRGVFLHRRVSRSTADQDSEHS